MIRSAKQEGGTNKVPPSSDFSALGVSAQARSASATAQDRVSVPFCGAIALPHMV